MTNDISDCVQVAVRIRPLVKSELDRGCQKIIDKVENEPQVVLKNHDSFTFNYVFGSEDNQGSIYQEAIIENLKKLFKGYNVTILAYGQTGSGKTHTMGTTFDGVFDEDCGIIPRAIYDIFKEIADMSSVYSFNITCSFMELYKEQLFDLLSSSPREQSIVDIREDGNRGIIIPGLTEIKVDTAQETTDCLIRGSAGRAVGATAMNTQSSRSHAIFTVTIQKTKISDSNTSTTSKFHLVDLAGSERSKKTKATGDRFKEGVKINQGLLALGNVISALGSGQSSGYVGYRDSKLTRLLQDSLGGNSITLMIACVSPADYNLDETLSTLRYADRAKKIKNKPIINQDPKVAEINRLNAIIDKLKWELLSKMETEATEGNRSFVDKQEMEFLQKRVHELTKKNRTIQEELQLILNDVAQVELRATLAETTKEQYKQKLNEIQQGVRQLKDNLNENECGEYYEKIKSLFEIAENVDQVIEKNEEDLISQNTFSQLSADFNSINDNELLQTNEVQQKLDAFTSKQLQYNNELRRINRELCLKEELHQKIAGNLSEFRSYEANSIEIKMKEYETHLKTLQDEKNDIEAKLNAKTNPSAKISEERRKRLQQLELEISELKKKNLQQEKMLKMREKESQKIINLSKEIQEMKAAKVKLIRELKNEAEKFKQWKLAKEKEVLQLKEKDRKRNNEFIRMKALHDKQRNVLKRKMEEAMAVNKRLKDTLDKTKSAQAHRKLLNSGKIGQVLSWFDQEFEIILSVTDAQNSLEHLIEDRAILTKRLNEIKEMDSSNSQEISSIENELSLRSAQINDLNQKIIDSNFEAKLNSISDGMQSMIESRAVLKHLISKIIEIRRYYANNEYKFEDLKAMYESNLEKLEKLERENEDTVAKFNEEKANIEQSYEEKIIILLKELNHIPNIVKGEVTPAMNERLKILQDSLDKYEEIRTEYEKYKKLYEDLKMQLQKSGNNKRPQNKRLMTLKEEKTEIIIESDQTMTEEDDDEDDLSNDPDWVKTPLFRQSRNSHNVTKASKRSSDGTVKCGCKRFCMSKNCSCKRSNINCSESCRCSDSCKNNKSIKQENETNSTTSEDDNKENINSSNNSSSDDHTPKKSKLTIKSEVDHNVTTPSYPYSNKKRNQFYIE